MKVICKSEWLGLAFKYGGFAETASSQFRRNWHTGVNFPDTSSLWPWSQHRTDSECLSSGPSETASSQFRRNWHTCVNSYLFLLLFLTCQFFSFQVDAKRKYLKIGKQETVTSEGIRLRVFKDVQSVPLPAVNTFTMRYSGNNKKIETYNPLELWKHDQHLVIWGNTLGFLTIGKMTLNAPYGIPRISSQHIYVLKDSYDKWKREHKVSWSKEETEKWLEHFTGTEIEGSPEKIKGPRGCVSYHYRLKFKTDYRDLYLIITNTTPKQRYVFLYGMKPGIDFKKSSRAISQSVSSIAFSKSKKKTDVQIAKEKLRRHKPLGKKDWTPEFIASREKVITNIKNLKDWWYVETDSFIITTNLKHKKTIDKIKIDLERCRKVYKQYFPIQGKIKAVSVVRVFKDRIGYVNYVGEKFQWTSGLWVPMKKELVISSSDWLKGKKQRQQMLRLIYHEGFHQYIHYATGEFSTSLWFNEGHATYFEAIKFKGRDKAVIGINEERYQHFREMLKQDRTYIFDLLRMDAERFYSGIRLKSNYALAWALVYFLNKGVPILKNKNNYDEILPVYYDALTKGNSPLQATALAWGKVDRNEFNRDFRRFWKSNRMVSRAKNYNPVSGRK